MNETGQFAEDVHQDIDADRISQWAELYALDAVSDAERNAIDEHISATSDEVRLDFVDRVRRAHETITAVYATYQEDPPARLWSRILERLSVDDTFATVSEVSLAASTVTVLTGDGGNELDKRRHRKATPASTARRWIIGVAAAAAMAVGSATVAQNLNEPSLQEQVVQASDVDSTTVQIPAGGVAEIKRSDSLNAAVVTLRNVPAPQPGKVYQMWRLPDNGSTPESMGSMTGKEVARPRTTVVRNIDPYSALAITVEPQDGSITPTMPVIAQIPLEA